MSFSSPVTDPEKPQSALFSVFPLSATRSIWSAYLLLIGVVSIACFGSLSEHLLDTHDDELFRDSIALSKDPSFFEVNGSDVLISDCRLSISHPL